MRVHKHQTILMNKRAFHLVGRAAPPDPPAFGTDRASMGRCRYEKIMLRLGPPFGRIWHEKSCLAQGSPGGPGNEEFTL